MTLLYFYTLLALITTMHDGIKLYPSSASVILARVRLNNYSVEIQQCLHCCVHVCMRDCSESTTKYYYDADTMVQLE